MVPFTKRLTTALQAASELGWQAVALLSVYRIGLKSGWVTRRTPTKPQFDRNQIQRAAAELPGRLSALPLAGSHPGRALAGLNQAEKEALLSEAGEIIAGQYRRYGGLAVPLALKPAGPREHWTHYTDADPANDLKDTWEDARFGWAYTLGRAWQLSGYEGYAAAFWKYTEDFLATNPTNLGPNWHSAQEVALRILAFTFGLAVFGGAQASTPERKARLVEAIAAHARRIPPTLVYARAQNNNHLLVEAAGLYTAGCLLPALPEAKTWKTLGWRWFNHAIGAQIDPQGTYIQHSMNYHRLMLQTGLWVTMLAQSSGENLPENSQKRLAAATGWLLAQLDPNSGRAPNLGSNDGAYILPLAPGGFDDYRPVAQAAANAFLRRPCLTPGGWDELGAWLGFNSMGRPPLEMPYSSPAVLRLNGKTSWASLRAVHFDGRPNHADQLHVELWWQGLNIARDGGSYRYTAPPPWENALAGTGVHNTVTIDGQDQMQRAGKFLWLKRAQARLLEATPASICAEHDGYRKLGVIHRRRLVFTAPNEWVVLDSLRTNHPGSSKHTLELHWLLPDYPFELEKNTLTLITPAGKVILEIHSSQSGEINLSRAGQTLSGKNANPLLGWYSPTYAQKSPALSLCFIIEISLPAEINSKFILQTSVR